MERHTFHRISMFTACSCFQDMPGKKLKCFALTLVIQASYAQGQLSPSPSDFLALAQIARRRPVDATGSAHLPDLSVSSRKTRPQETEPFRLLHVRTAHGQRATLRLWLGARPFGKLQCILFQGKDFCKLFGERSLEESSSSFEHSWPGHLTQRFFTHFQSFSYTYTFVF